MRWDFLKGQSEEHLHTMSQEEKRGAVYTRDNEYDGSFVYGVSSTGIYCKPSCPSKKPKEENMVFFGSPSEAEVSGFRPCKRCHPEKVEHSPTEYLVKAITGFIDSNLDERLTLEVLSQEFDISPHHLQRSFKKVMGISPRQYTESRRLERFKDGLRNGAKVDSAMQSSGFTSRSRLYEKTPGKIGMTPTEYRQGGPDVLISYTVTVTPFSKLLVATTERGVCAVYLGNSEPRLLELLREEYQAARIVRDDATLERFVGPLLDYFDGKNFNPSLPLDIHRTAFQWRVYEAIQSIPPGTTTTYSEIAEEIGRSKASRAVANACASNPVSLIVPCHRVVRKDGGLGGYTGGIELKEKLLRHEDSVAENSPSSH
jgi:AraC family transcriptional regulator of adaptative response/methylated-DNA-[protein]-cysteine methyltransferase